MFAALNALVSMKSRRGSTSSPISIVNTRSASIASSICTLSSRRTFGSILVSTAARGSSRPGPWSAGALGFAQQPLHRLPEVAHALLLRLLALAALHQRALGQQPAEGV